MIVKDVCMHTVVCTVQGSLFVQYLFKKRKSYSFFFFSFTANYGSNADVNVQDKCMKRRKIQRNGSVEVEIEDEKCCS